MESRCLESEILLSAPLTERLKGWQGGLGFISHRIHIKGKEWEGGLHVAQLREEPQSGLLLQYRWGTPAMNTKPKVLRLHSASHRMSCSVCACVFSCAFPVIHSALWWTKMWINLAVFWAREWEQLNSLLSNKWTLCACSYPFHCFLLPLLGECKLICSPKHWRFVCRFLYLHN